MIRRILLLITLLSFGLMDLVAQTCVPVTLSSSFSRTLAARKHSISNLQLNNVSTNTIYVGAGSSVNVKFNYSISQDGSYCPGCGVQFYWGINGHYSTCERHYGGYCNCSGSVNKNITAPSTPGVYYLSVGNSLDFGCSNNVNRPRTDRSSAFAAIVVGSPFDNISRAITASPATADGINPVTLNAPFTGSGCYNYTDIRWYKDGTYLGSSFDDLNTITVTDPASYFAMNFVPGFDTIYSDTISVAPSTPGAGYSLEFDGNDQIRTNHSSSLNLSSNGELTIEAWVKLDNFSSDSRTILMKGSYGWALAIEGASGANNGKIGFWDQGGWTSVPK